MTESIITIILIGAAVARLTRLTTTDRITENPRLKLIEKRGPDSLLVYLAHCQWCTGLWFGIIGAIVAAVVAPIPDVNVAVQIVGLSGLYGYVTGVLAEKFGTPTVEGGEA